MIDIKLIRKNPELVVNALKKRNHETDLINQIKELDERKREIQKEVEKLRSQRNAFSKQVAKLKAAGNEEEFKKIMEESKEIGNKIKELETLMKNIEDKIHIKLLYIPNIPDESVPIGKSEDDNVEIRKWGKPREFDFEPKAHWDLGPELGMLDFERASKISGSRFSIIKSFKSCSDGVLLYVCLNAEIGFFMLYKVSFIIPSANSFILLPLQIILIVMILFFAFFFF